MSYGCIHSTHAVMSWARNLQAGTYADGTSCISLLNYFEAMWKCIYVFPIVSWHWDTNIHVCSYPDDMLFMYIWLQHQILVIDIRCFILIKIMARHAMRGCSVCVVIEVYSYQHIDSWECMCVISTVHYNDVIMGAIAYQITSLTIVYLTVYSDADQRKHQSSASLAFMRGIHRRPVNSSHKWPVTRKMFPFDDVIMNY